MDISIDENNFFSYIDYFFANQFLKKEDNENSFFALQYLFFISRLGHLCLKVDFSKNTIFPLLFSLDEKKVINGLLSLSSDLIAKEKKEIFKKPICFFKNSFYLQRNYIFESRILENLKKDRNKKSFFNKKIEKKLQKFLLQKEIYPSQKEAIEKFLRSKKNIFFIFGGPGTGKSYSAKVLIDLLLEYEKKGPLKIIVAAFCARAVKLLEKKHENISFKTLHSLLFFEKSNFADVLIIDEASMIDAKLFSLLLEKFINTKILFIGDPNQLPPIESRAIFSLFTKFENSIFLKQNKRFENEEVNQFIKLIEEKEVDKTKIDSFLKDKKNVKIFYLKEKEDFFSTLFNWIDSYFTKEFFIGPIEKIFEKFSKFKILSSQKYGALGVININKIVLQYLQEKFGLSIFFPIIVEKNDYNLNIFNGDMGIVFQDQAYFKEDQKIKKIPLFMIESFSRAFAISVHKSQGSEFDDVFLILSKKSTFFGKELLYTAITRVKKKLCILSEKDTFFHMLKKTKEISSNLYF